MCEHKKVWSYNSAVIGKLKINACIKCRIHMRHNKRRTKYIPWKSAGYLEYDFIRLRPTGVVVDNV